MGTHQDARPSLSTTQSVLSELVKSPPQVHRLHNATASSSSILLPYSSFDRIIDMAYPSSTHKKKFQERFGDGCRLLVSNAVSIAGKLSPRPKDDDDDEEELWGTPTQIFPPISLLAVQSASGEGAAVDAEIIVGGGTARSRFTDRVRTRSEHRVRGDSRWQGSAEVLTPPMPSTPDFLRPPVFTPRGSPSAGSIYLTPNHARSSPSLHMYTPLTPTHGSFRGRGSAAGSYFPAAGASSPITSSYFPSTSSSHSPSFDVDVGSPRTGRYQRKIPITKIGLFVDEGGYREYYEVSWYSGYTWDRLQKRIIRKLARHEYLVGGRRVEFTYRDQNRRDRRIVGDADIAVVLGSPSPEIWVGFSV